MIRFTDSNQEMTNFRFEERLNIARILGEQEEKYYQDKVNSNLINADDGNMLLPMESLQYSMI